MMLPHEGVSSGTPDAEERERSLDQDVVGDDQREEDQRRGHDVRQELARHHPQRPRPVRDRGLHELLAPQREHLAADRPGDVGHEDDGDDHDRDPDRRRRDVQGTELESADLERGRERDREQVDRERPDDVERARDERIGRSSERACDEREHERQRDAEERRRDTDQQRRTPSVQHAHEQVPTVRIGAEQVAGRAVPARSACRRGRPPAPCACPPARSRRCSDRSGPWCATKCTHSGAPIVHTNRISRKTVPDAIATRLRRRRRHAIRQGPATWTATSTGRARSSSG